MRALALSLLASALIAAEYTAPAGDRPAIPRPGAVSVLPGGRLLQPHGRQYATGPGPFGVAASPSGRRIVTVNGGPDEFSLSVLERDELGRFRVSHIVAPRAGSPEAKEDTWRSVAMGVAFAGEQEVFVSEGNSGRVRRVRLANPKRVQLYELNRDGFQHSFTGDLAFDETRQLLYVLDQANFRLVVIDVPRRREIASVRVGRLPFAISLAPDGKRAYVANVGMFEYKLVPGANAANAAETGLPFPAFGFPSADAFRGARRQTAAGPVDVPGLGDPNVPESNSLSVVNVEDPTRPRVEAFVRTGLPVSGTIFGGSSPSGVLATQERIFVANAHNDSISVIDARSLAIVQEIPLRIPGLESLRGVLPVGLALHEPSGWLLVAEAGINAIGVIDTKTLAVLGHIPAAWFPVALTVHQDDVFVVSAKGHGTGANANRMVGFSERFQPLERRGAITVFPIPAARDLPKLTLRVMQLNGFVPDRKATPPEYPRDIRHVVLIVKESRSFDEVFGDIEQASNGPVDGAPMLARFGRYGSVAETGGRFPQRFSLRGINVTPNHHAMADRWCFSDNFYSDAETSVEGHHWLTGAYPNAWTVSTFMAAYGGEKNYEFPTNAPGRLLFAGSNSSVHPEEIPEAGTLWHHLERHGISFRNFGEGFELAGVVRGDAMKPTGARFLANIPMPEALFQNTSREYPQYNTDISDQHRATQFIQEIDRLYVQTGKPLPRFLYLHLPNDDLAPARPADGYPFAASFMADNDYALGRIVEYLSRTPWWNHMAIFVSEDDAQGGVDHVDSHRTLMLAIGPHMRKNYVSRRNTSYPGLLKTVFRLLGVPPLNLFDATATDLSDCFAPEPDFTPYEVQPVIPELFDPTRLAN
jgi:DNA-binding beta-propeller fold protein YncE